MKPSIGRIVHYNDPQFGIKPAIVTQVYTEGGTVVELCVFTPSPTPKTSIAESKLAPDLESGTWGWPPRV